MELLGRNRLMDELLRAGLEIALPIRDRGIDLLVYADQKKKFAAVPVQMKASSKQSFGLSQKYAKFPGLLLAYIWNIERMGHEETFALTYGEALRVAKKMGWTATVSWGVGRMSTTNQGRNLEDSLSHTG